MKSSMHLKLTGLLAIVGSLIVIAPVATLNAATPTAPSAIFNLTGFGQTTTGGGEIAETDPAYRKVATPAQFAQAIYDATKNADGKPNAVKVIEVTSDLDLGYNEIGGAAFSSTFGQFRAAATPLLHPALIAKGVSIVDISIKGSGLTIFSANGSAIRHCKLNIKGCSNVIIRNLRFEELWEWDETGKGNYDKNDWDFITLGDGGGTVSNVWIDHCTFTKAYDGCIDMKAPTNGITVSWCTIVGDDSTNTGFVRQQMDWLENNHGHAFYDFLRAHGFSEEQIIQTIKGTDKTSLVGATSLQAANNNISATYHHIRLNNVWDRSVPRLRGGNVHVYNVVADATDTYIAKKIRDSIVAGYDAATLKSFGSYNFSPPLNGCISTEGAALLLEKSVYTNVLTPLRNNQTDVTQAKYTGKIEGRDVIYNMNAVTVTGGVASLGTLTTTRGNSTDAGSQLGPIQAPIIPFSWNTITAPGGVLPYTISYMDDPSTLPAVLDAGAGSGAITWSDGNGKLNWLKTTYAGSLPAAAPSISISPVSQSAFLGSNVTLSVAASGSPLPTYQWYKNGAPVTGATNATLTLNNVSTLDAGNYYVVASNGSGPDATSTTATLTIVTTLNIPTATAASGPTLTGFTANWTAATGATGYSLDISGDATFGTCIPGYDNLAVGSSTSYAVTGLNAATTYYYRVRATVGTSSSANSNTIIAATNNTSGGGTLVNDALNDTDRIGGLPGSNTTSTTTPVNNPTTTNTQWVASQSKSLVASSGGLNWSFGTASNSVIMGYMPEFTVSANTPVTLTLNFTTGGQGTSASSMYIALLHDTAATRRMTDGFGSTDTSFPGDVGYSFMTSGNIVGGTSTTNLVLNTFKRVTTTSNNLFGAGTDWGTALTPTTPNAGSGYLAPNTNYVLTVTLSYDGTALTITTSIGGTNFTNYSYAITDSNAPVLSYNMLALRFGAGTNQFGFVNLTSLQVMGGTATTVPSIPAIYSAATANGTQGQALSYAVAATNAPTTYAASGLPNGVTCNSTTGVISGTPTENGNFTVTLTATNANGTSANFLLILNVAAPDIAPAAPVATAATNPTSSGFTANWNAVTGATGYYMDVSTNSGFSTYVTNYQAMDTGGVTTWTFSDLIASTTYYYRVSAYNDTGISTASNVITATTSAGAAVPVISGSNSAPATQSGGFNYQIAASNAPTSYAIVNGTLPAGVTLNTTTGLISGTPTATGIFNVTLSATNAGGDSATFSLTITVAPAAAADVIVDDIFTDTDRIGGTSGATPVKSGPPFTSTPTATNTQWVSSSTTTKLIATSTGMMWNWNTTDTSVVIMGYFPNVTIHSGTTTTVALSFTTGDAVSGGAASNIRFALVDDKFSTSAAERLNCDLTTTTDTRYADDTGYCFIPGSTIGAGNTTDLLLTSGKRNATGIASSTLLTNGIGSNWDSLGDSTGQTGYFAEHTAYTMKFVFAYDGTNLQITTAIDGGAFGTGAYSYTVTDSTNPNLVFNTIAMRIAGLKMYSYLKFTELKVSQAASVAPAAPSITTQPQTQTVAVGDNVTLSVVAAGGGVLTYQWNKNGTAISGATTSSLNFPNAAVADSGSYTVTITNAGGSITSNTTTLTVNPVAAVPVVTSGTTATATVGTTFSYTITGSNSPTGFGATGLPASASLTLNPTTGAISGTPVAADVGTSLVTLTATNAAGTSLPMTLTLTINPAATSVPVVNSGTIAAATVGAAFTYNITASNNPTSYAATGLPASLNCSTSTGAITGTPTAAGTFSVTLTATNATGASAPVTLTLTVNPAATSVPVINSGTIAAATVGAAFTYNITASNNPTSYAATGLPAGLNCSTSTGAITGTPTVAGTFSVTLTAGNATGTSLPVTLALTVNPAGGSGGTGEVTPVITSARSASVTVGTAFTYSITANNTATSYSAAGLPPGLTINTTTGAITGTPTAIGNYSVTLGATNGAGTGNATLTLSVTSAGGTPPNNVSIPPVITSLASDGAQVGVPFSYQITATGSPVSFTATGLPDGLSINKGTGLITGTPTTTGNYIATIGATNPYGTGTQQLAITIDGKTSLTTLAGQNGTAGTANGSSASARFDAPSDAVTDAAGNLYIVDTDNDTIRKIAPNGTVTTFAGQAGIAGSGNGIGTAATFNKPTSIAINVAGTMLYIADTGNDTIRAINVATGNVTTLAGAAGLASSADGTGAAARFDSPSGLAIDAAGNLYVADTGNDTIRKVNTATGVVTTAVGNAGNSGSADGIATTATLDMPTGLAFSPDGMTLYIADTGNSSVRSYNLGTGEVATLATSASGLNTPQGLAVDAAGNVYVANTGNDTIVKIDGATHTVTTVAGNSGLSGSSDGLGSQSRLNSPGGLAVDFNGDIYIMDTGNNTIRVLQVGPAFTTSPASQTVNAGASVTLKATVSGAPAPSYQWYKNSNAISGASKATYTISSAQASDAASYTVTATNSMGTAQSAAATLTVNASGTPGGGDTGKNSNGGGGGGAPGWYYLLALAALGAMRALQGRRNRRA